MYLYAHVSTHTLSQYHDIIRQVQAETERLPTVDPNHIPIEPFSPPATPSRLTPPLFGENPFASDEFVNLPARRFREGEFEKFSGDPFESVEIFDEPPIHSTEATTGGGTYTEGALQQFQVNTGSVESISQESQASQTNSHSSGVENEDPEPVEQHDYYTLEDPSQTADQAHSSELIPSSHHNDPDLSPRDSANLSQTSSVLESESEKSSPSSRRSEQRSRKSKSSVESLQDVVVTEREEPMLQVRRERRKDGV